MQFTRRVELTVGESGGSAIVIKDLRVAFSIAKTSSQNPNKCTAKVYNLSEASRAVVEGANKVLILKAGYQDEGGALTIFTGTVIRSLTYVENADWITEFEMSDSFLEFRDAKITADFQPGSSGLAVVRHFANALNLPIRPFPSVADKEYPGGFSFVGRVRDGMNKACKYLGLEWSLQNREVQLVAVGGVSSTQAILISSETGMIDHPKREEKTISDKLAAEKGLTNGQGAVKKEYTDSKGNAKTKYEVLGYKVKTLLNPVAEPGGYARLKSVGVDGYFRIEAVDHVGDTHSNDWYSEITLRFLNG